MPATFALRVNGATRQVTVEPDTPLLYVLRNDLELNGAKFGCGQAQCGACSVLVDGREVRSCVVSVAVAAKGRITTIEGLGTAEKPSALQRAFIQEQACGLAPDARFDMEGFKTVLALRAEIEGQWGGKPPAPDRYIDLRYYQRAVERLGGK